MREDEDGRVHIHLDPLGGIAGDMFAAAMLDAWPEHEVHLAESLARLPLPDGVSWEVAAHHDGVLSGRRFAVREPHHHHHTAFADIRGRLERSDMPDPVRDRATAIFTLLAEAEGAVHGIAPDSVTFHEVGAWDSIVDVVSAAILIEAVGPATWSASVLPTGSGRVKTAHGELPVPTPATERLLRGFVLQDDGRTGERVTPTGAAIFRHLAPVQTAVRTPRVLRRSGVGFGSRRLEGMSNVLRVLAYDAAPASGTETVAEVAFEVDDQTPEDLAVAADRLRAVEGVLDLWQVPVQGKKGRMAMALRLLVRPERLDAVTAACFAETTTIGLRWHLCERAVLPRRAVTVGATRAKLVTRGETRTAKAEMDDIARAGTHIDRETFRRAVEDEALKDEEPE